MVITFSDARILFRAIENFKMFDMVNLLTSGGPDRPRRSPGHHAEARSIREVAHRLFSALAIILFVTPCSARPNIYVKALNRVKQR